MNGIKGLKRLSEIPRCPRDMKGLREMFGDRVYIHPVYTVVRIVWDKNGCCPDLPILLTTNRRPDGTINYSCQCACGIWVTNGFNNAEDAIRDYERMTAGTK